MDLPGGQRLDPSERYLVTGAAGFIGSNLVEELLRQGQRVVGLDNFATGHRHNLEDAVARAGEEAADRFTFVEGDIRDPEVCAQACEGVAVVLHQAALGSVPRSISLPVQTHEVNATGFLYMLLAARDAGVRRFIYASSSSVYGDHPALPKVEEEVGVPLSPYAITKKTNELYARTAHDHYGLETIGLRYFNVFGRRQDPDGAYAAVIPKWIGQLLGGDRPIVHGDGETSRDFCYVANVVQVNLLAALAPSPQPGAVYNVAYGERTTLNELYALLVEGIAAERDQPLPYAPQYGPFRPGDIRHSLADISRAREHLGYTPTHSVRDGLAETLAWYCAQAELTA